MEAKTRRIAAALLGSTILGTLALLLYASGLWDEPDWYDLTGIGIFALWAVSPYVFGLLICCRKGVKGARLYLRSVTAVLLAGAASLVYMDVFLFPSSSTGALVVIFIPSYQWVLLFIAFAVSLFFGRGFGRSQEDK